MREICSSVNGVYDSYRTCSFSIAYLVELSIRWGVLLVTNIHASFNFLNLLLDLYCLIQGKFAAPSYKSKDEGKYETSNDKDFCNLLLSMFFSIMYRHRWKLKSIEPSHNMAPFLLLVVYSSLVFFWVLSLRSLIILRSGFVIELWGFGLFFLRLIIFLSLLVLLVWMIAFSIFWFFHWWQLLFTSLQLDIEAEVLLNWQGSVISCLCLIL